MCNLQELIQLNIFGCVYHSLESCYQLTNTLFFQKKKKKLVRNRITFNIRRVLTSYPHILNDGLKQKVLNEEEKICLLFTEVGESRVKKITIKQFPCRHLLTDMH